MPDLNNALSKRLEAERAATEIENQINERKRKHAELEVQLSENEKSVQSSLQSIDYLEQLKQTKLQQLKEADQALSIAEKKTLEVIRNRQNAQRVKCREINSLLGKLYKLYNEVLTESADIDAAGFRRLNPNSNSIDLPQQFNDRNVHSWMAQLPAYLETKNIEQIILMPLTEVESRNQRVL